MSYTKKLNTLISNGAFSGSDASKLSKNSYANLFDVVNKGEKSYFNLSKNVTFENNDSIGVNDIQDYITNDGDTWPLISYKFYNTIELWWLICKFNNIKNPFNIIEAGQYIKVPSEELKDQILKIISTY